LNERWNRDWHVRVDSLYSTVVQANFVQPGVIVPAGRHYIEFEYKPMLFWYLMILQRITFLLLIAIVLWKWCRQWVIQSSAIFGTPELR
jgi:hypothetical protein